MGAEWVDAGKVGELVGIKIIINEFVAYTELKALAGIISVRRALYFSEFCKLLNFAGEINDCCHLRLVWIF